MTSQNCWSSAESDPSSAVERGKKLALQAVEDRRQVKHAFQTRQLAPHSNPAQQILNKTKF